MSTPIHPEDIKSGDLIRKEYFPKLGSVIAREYDAAHDGDSGVPPGCHFLLHRDVPTVVLPTEPGHYLDKDNDAWTLDIDDLGWNSLPPQYAPYVRVEPVAETVKKVMAEFRAGWLSTDLMLSQYMDSFAAEFGVTKS